MATDNIGLVPCPAWAFVIESDPELRAKLQAGTATPREAAEGFGRALGLEAREIDTIEGVIKFADKADAKHNRVGLANGLFLTGPAIHREMDFGIARYRSELAAKGVPEDEIERKVGARFDEIFRAHAVEHDGELVIPINPANVKAIVHGGIQLRLAEDPGAQELALKNNVVMAGEIGALAFAHKFIGRGNIGRASTLHYDELKRFMIQRRLPDTRLLSALLDKTLSRDEIEDHLRRHFGPRPARRGSGHPGCDARGAVSGAQPAVQGRTAADASSQRGPWRQQGLIRSLE
jgi:hypothetical protein